MADLIEPVVKWHPANRLRRFSTIAFVLVFAAVGTYILFHSFAASPKPLQNDDVTTLELLNGQIEAMSRAVRADSGRKGTVAKQLASISQKRQAILERVIKSDPSTAAGLMLGDKNLANLNGISGSTLEKKVTLTGIYYVRAVDGEPETDNLISNGTDYSIYTNGVFPDIPIESNVSVTGYQFGDALFVPTYLKNRIKVKVNSAPPKNHKVAAGSALAAGISHTKTPSNVLAATQTVTNLVVIEVNFSGFNPIDDNVVRSAISNNPGRDLASYWLEQSYGKEVMNPTYLSPFPITSATCPANPATAFMNQYGSTINWSLYQRYSMYFNCGGAGAEIQIQIPGGGSILGSQLSYPNWTTKLTAATAHELSHAAGVGNNHAQFYDCQPQVFIPPTRFGDNCVSYAYANPFDVLGSVDFGGTTVNHIDALHKSHAGWFDPANYPTITSSGTYKILPYETPTTGILALNIPRGNSGTAFTLEYRQPIGFDSWMTASDPLCGSVCTADKGPMINFNYRIPVGVSYGDTQLLDVTPLSNVGRAIYNDVFDGMLVPGKTFTDPEYGISVTTQSADATGATVQVTIPSSATCTRVGPTVTPLSSTSQTVAPGQTATYTYTVKSNDSAGCSPIKHKYSWPDDIAGSRNNKATNSSNTSLTNQFTHVASPDVFTLAPGASTTVTVSVSPTNTTTINSMSNVITNGTWADASVGTISSDSLATSTASMGSVLYTVTSAADTVAPSSPTSLVAQVLGSGAVKFNWGASTDNSGVVAGYVVTIDGVSTYQTNQPSIFVYGADGQTFLSAGSHSVSIQAVDRSNHFSTAATASFTIPAKTDTVRPPPPAIINTVATDHSVTITWAATTDNVGVVGYKVYIGGIGGTVIVPTANTPTYSYTFDGLPGNTNQDYTVQAFDGDGTYSWSAGGSAYLDNTATIPTANAGTLPPTAPTAVHWTQATNASVTIAWQASSDDRGVTGYRIYKYGLPYATVASTSFTDTTTSANATPKYQVQALDSDGNISPLVSAETNNFLNVNTSGDTQAPTNVVLTSPSNGANVGATLSLAATAQDNVAVTGINYYIDGVSMTQAAPPFNASFDMSLTYHGTHTIWAEARDLAGNLTSSNVITITNNVGGGGPKPGDVDGSGFVDSADLAIIVSNYSRTCMTYAQGNLDGDTDNTCPSPTSGKGTVNIFDASILATHIGT